MKVRVEHESGKTETTFVSAGLMRLCDIEEVEGVADRVLYAVWYDWRHRRGWTDEDLRKLAREHVLRVMNDVEAAAH